MIKKIISAIFLFAIVVIFLLMAESLITTYIYWRAYYRTGEASVIKLNKKYDASNSRVIFSTELNIPKDEYYCRISNIIFFIASAGKVNIEDILKGKKCKVSSQYNNAEKAITCFMKKFGRKDSYAYVGYGSGRIKLPTNAVTFWAYTDSESITYHKGDNRIKISISPIDKSDYDNLSASLFFMASTEKAARLAVLGITVFYLIILGLLIFIFQRLTAKNNLLLGD